MDNKIEDLLKSRIIDMTGNELVSVIIYAASKSDLTKVGSSLPTLVYGIDGLARLLNVSTATAMRMKKSGIFDPAISQIERTVVIDVQKALLLMHNSYMNNKDNDEQ
jgi:hypothetical protein